MRRYFGYSSIFLVQRNFEFKSISLLNAMWEFSSFIPSTSVKKILVLIYLNLFIIMIFSSFSVLHDLLWFPLWLHFMFMLHTIPNEMEHKKNVDKIIEAPICFIRQVADT